MAIRDPYESLGVPRGATQAEIAAAYKSLAKKYHPDLNPGDTVAAQRMREINAAYNLLKEEVGQTQDESRFSGLHNDFAGDGGHWEEYTSEEEARRAVERAERMAVAFAKDVRARRRAQASRSVYRILVWVALIAMLGGLLYQAFAPHTASLGPMNGYPR